SSVCARASSRAVRKHAGAAALRRCAAAAVLFAIAAVAGSGGPEVGRAQESAVTGLTAAAEVRRAYDAVFDARFDEVPGLLERTCPPAPDEACRLVETLALWWQIQLDPNDTSR